MTALSICRARSAQFGVCIKRIHTFDAVGKGDTPDVVVWVGQLDKRPRHDFHKVIHETCRVVDACQVKGRLFKVKLSMDNRYIKQPTGQITTSPLPSLSDI